MGTRSGSPNKARFCAQSTANKYGYLTTKKTYRDFGLRLMRAAFASWDAFPPATSQMCERDSTRRHDAAHTLPKANSELILSLNTPERVM